MELSGISGPDITAHPTICDICCPSFHCGVDAWVRDGKIIKIEGTKNHPVNHGKLCAKGLAARQYIYSPDRIRTPLHRVGPRGSGRFEPVSWDIALDEIGERLLDIRSRYGAESVLFTSGYSKWYRDYLHRLACSFGSPNYMTESSNCMFSTFLQWYVTTGNPMCSADLTHCGVFLGWAFNPYYSRFPAAFSVEKRKKEGMKVIIVDPRITPASLQLADIHLRPRTGTDGAVALGLAYLLIRSGKTDDEYISRYVYGFAEYKQYVQQFPPERVEALTGIPAQQLIAAAELIGNNLPLAINESAAPISHHPNGFQNYRAIMSLSAILGCFDRPGGQIPVRFTYNYLCGGLPSREEEFIYAHAEHIKAPAIGAARFPLWAKYIHEAQANDLPRQIETGSPYPIKALLGFGYNYRIGPNDRRTREALLQLDFLVNTELFMTDTCKFCDIVLPACTSYERSELKTYANGGLLYTTPVIPPLYDSRDDITILCDIARRIVPDDELLCAGPDACAKWFIQDYPVTLEQLKTACGIVNVPAEHYIPGSMLERGLDTTSGKFELYSNTIAAIPGLEPLPIYTPPQPATEGLPFLLSSSPRIPGMLHTRLQNIPWAHSLRPESLADIHPDDAAALNISNGDLVEISTELGSIKIKANLTYKTERGTVSVIHGYNENDINSIIPEIFDPYSGFACFREVRVSLRRCR